MPIEEDADSDRLSEPHYDAVTGCDDTAVLEALDIGVVVFDATTRRIHRANPAARFALRSFGNESDTIPDDLWPTLLAAITSARVLRGRFTPAVQATGRDARRYFVRCRYIGTSGVVLVINVAGFREKDVKRVLMDKLGFNTQEARIAFLAAQGFRNREIAQHLNIVEGTVKNYLTSIFAALSVRSRTELGMELQQLLEEESGVHRK